MQFVVFTITTEAYAERIEIFFIEDVVLLFGMIVVLAVDSNSQFKRIFTDM